MARTVLLIEPYVTIRIDQETNVLYIDWWGDITKENVLDGSALIVEILNREKCTKVLNNNSNVRKFWKGTTKWANMVGFPQLEETTCEYFAWVKPPSSDLNTDYLERLTLYKLEVNIFSSFLAGERWLANQQQAKKRRKTYEEIESEQY